MHLQITFAGGSRLHDLGNLFYKGEECVAQDFAEALKWWRLAASEHDHPAAICNVGYMYDNGKGVPKCKREGCKWYQRAAALGNPTAMFLYAAILATGDEGVRQDGAMALHYAQRGAESGDQQSRALLDIMQDGGLIPDPPLATVVTVILLASAAAAAKYNGKKGTIVAAPAGGQRAVKVGRAAVLLEGEAKPMSFKLMNIKVEG